MAAPTPAQGGTGETTQGQSQPAVVGGSAPPIPVAVPGVFPIAGGGVIPSAADSNSFLNPFAIAAIAAANHQIAQQVLLSQQPAFVNSTVNTNTSARVSVSSQPATTTTGGSEVQTNPSALAATNGSAGDRSGSTVATPTTLLPPLVFAPHSVAAFLGALQQHQQNSGNSAAAALVRPHPLIPGTSVAHAAAQVAAVHRSAVNPSAATMTNAMLSNMQHWKLGQLESHVQLLKERNQAVPQPIALLLADARRKEEKKTAKRVANRKSACSSRARKKALVEEMTKANARLRRQAMILALLPDLVIAITVDGKITFCSAQVERVLRHKIGHLVGANFEDILVPSSREKLRNLARQLLSAEQAAVGKATTDGVDPAVVELVTKSGDAENGNSASVSGREVSSGGEAVRVSERSFPLSVVKVKSQLVFDNSDLSISNGGRAPAVVSDLSLSNSSSGNRGYDEATARRADVPGGTVKPTDMSQVKNDVCSGFTNPQAAQLQASSDDSFSSSSDKNLSKANEALGHNVRWHNEKLLANKAEEKELSHKDDVTGASVTANNADARLSSLQHRVDSPTGDKEPTLKRKASRCDSLEDESSSSSDSLLDRNEGKKKARKSANENTSDDSGYRESNDSMREDTFSTSDDSSNVRNAGPRPKPLAPACTICLIRNDLTTIWCEVTSSIRTRSTKDGDEDDDDDMPSAALGEPIGPLETRPVSSKDASSSTEEDEITKAEIKELLLCLRPIRDGEGTVDESLRFVPPEMKLDGDHNTATASGSSPYNSATTSSDNTSGSAYARQRLPNKRPVVSDPFVTRFSSSSLSNDFGLSPSKKLRLQDTAAEKSVVESLMLMGKNDK